MRSSYSRGNGHRQGWKYRLPPARRQQTLDAIAELEQQHADGTIETPAYLIKKRSLVRML